MGLTASKALYGSYASVYHAQGRALPWLFGWLTCNRANMVVPRDRLGSGAKRGVCCGGVLLSHTLPGAVPSALAGLASRFGMEAGRFPAAMTTTRWFNHILLNTPTVAAGLGGVRGLCWL